MHQVCTRIGVHQVCTKCAPGVHQVCTRCAPGVHYLGVHHVFTVHQVCTRCAPGVHWGVHQVCTRCALGCAPGVHQVCRVTLPNCHTFAKCSTWLGTIKKTGASLELQTRYLYSLHLILPYTRCKLQTTMYSKYCPPNFS